MESDIKSVTRHAKENIDIRKITGTEIEKYYCSSTWAIK